MLLFLSLNALAATPVFESYLDADVLESIQHKHPIGVVGWTGTGQAIIHSDEATTKHLLDAGIPLGSVQKEASPPMDISADLFHDELRKLADKHASAQLLTLGHSLEGQPLLGLRVGESNPIWRIIGGHHGDETIAPRIVVEVARKLLEKSPPFDEVTPRGSIIFVPLLNPDGLNDGSRYNRRGVDLNRNYSWHWEAKEFRPGAHAFSEPETQAIQSLSTLGVSHTELNVHSGATNLAWVWNWTTTPSPHETVLQEIAEAYASRCAQEGFWLTNGAEWYVTYGDATDWAYGTRGNLSFTLEISDEKSPPQAEEASIIEDHLDAIANWMELEPNLQLQLVDASTQRPIQGSLRIPQQEATISNDVATGDFFHLLSPGTWEIAVESPGYASQNIRIEIPAEGTLSDTLSLEPDNLLNTELPSRLFSWSDQPQEWVLPESLQDIQWLQLTKVGSPEQMLSVEDGLVEIKSNLLSPGPWSVHTSKGSAPHSVFIGERNQELFLLDYHLDGPRLYLEFAEISTRAQVFAIWGTDRSWTPVPVTNWISTELSLDISNVPAAHRVDLLIFDQNRVVSLLDLFGDPILDVQPPDDTGFYEDLPADSTGNDWNGDTELTASSCTCSQSETDSQHVWLLSFGLLVLHRRKRKDTEDIIAQKNS